MFILSIGSSILAALLTYDPINIQSISNFSTELLKNIFNIPAQAVLSVTIPSSSERALLLLIGVLSEKGLYMFQNVLLSLMRLGSTFS